MTELKQGDSRVRIDKGELIGFTVSGHEFIHQKGSPGWWFSDTEMFPVIGQTDEANYRVHVPRGNALQDLHGIAGEIPYKRTEMSDTLAVFRKSYKAGTPIENSLYPESSKARLLIWPYDFVLEKKFELSDEGLKISFTIEGESDMPYMFGYHPAFKLSSADTQIIACEKEITIPEVIAVGGRAMEVPDCEKIMLRDSRDLEIKSEGFGQFMLWTPVENMVCIEPVSFYPYQVEQSHLHEGFRHLGKTADTYTISINPI